MKRLSWLLTVCVLFFSCTKDLAHHEDESKLVSEEDQKKIDEYKKVNNIDDLMPFFIFIFY